MARDTANPESDIDLLVEFDRPTGLFGLIDLQLHLEEQLNMKVDIGTLDSLKPRVRDRVSKESIYAN